MNIVDSERLKKCCYIVLAFATFFRIVLSSGYVYEYIVNAGMDDQWMVISAYNILGGQWLGAYGSTTLIKSVTYPFMLAFFRALGIPYGIGLGVFVALVTYVFVKAIKPVAKNLLLRSVIYISVLYSPFGFLTITSARIYRTSVSHWMTLLVIASYIGLYFRRDWEIKKLWKWIVCEAVALMMFWELREDHIWILAFVIPAFLIILIYRIWHNKKDFLKNTVVMLVPFVMTVVMEIGIATINYNKYGVFTGNDRTGTYCGKVMSLLYKIDDGEVHDQSVWVSEGAFKKAMEVSPTLNKYSEMLDEEFNNWRIPTQYGIEVQGDHAEWALRGALDNAGLYKDAVSTNEEYKKIYNDLKTGFESGMLKEKKGISLSSQMRPFNMNDIDVAFSLTRKVMFKYANYDSRTGVYVAYTTAGMDPDEKSMFENILLMNITEQHPDADRDQISLGERATQRYGVLVMKIFNAMHKVYKRLAVFLNYICLGIMIFMVASMICELKNKS
ncbi:MAG: hypothetical protein IJT72_07870, partial [Lachnospiraceae bacterium]|nr:hypothetical protein [Lachnospiraceae bacterium]